MSTRPVSAARSRPLMILLAMVLAVLGLVMACGTGTSDPATSGAATSGNGPGGAVVTPAPSSDTIVIQNFAYQPASLTVAPGTKITVINQDAPPHTVTATDHSFDSGIIPGGQSGEVTAPTTPGTYPYFCTVHPFMKGTLIVR